MTQKRYQGRLQSERDTQDAALLNLRNDLKECAETRNGVINNLLQALHEIAEEWAGAEVGEPVTAQEAYAVSLARRMYGTAVAATDKARGET